MAVSGKPSRMERLPPATSITPDWTTSVNVRFTPQNSGTYDLTFKLKTTGDEVLAEKTESVTVTGAMQISASVPTFRVDTTAQFTLSTVANGDAGPNGTGAFHDPNGNNARVSGKRLRRLACRFPLSMARQRALAVADATMSLRATFSEAGTKTITVQYIEVSTATVLASKDIEVTVEQPMAVSAMLPTFYAGEPATFTLTTVAHDDAGKLARAYFTVPSDVTLEYQEEGTGTWLPITDAYGPVTGFAIADATYTFRATCAGIGMKPITVQFIEVGTGIVLADESFIATVEYRVQPSIVVPGLDHLTISANTTDVNLGLENPSDNACLFVISLELDDGTVLYTSGLLAPGDEVGDVTLSQALSPGTYEAVIRYEAYDADDLSPLNSAEVTISLVVQ